MNNIMNSLKKNPVFLTIMDGLLVFASLAIITYIYIHWSRSIALIVPFVVGMFSTFLFIKDCNKIDYTKKQDMKNWREKGVIR